MSRPPAEARPLSERLYQRLLAIYPAAYRREYGPLMLQLFRDLRREASRRGKRRDQAVLWLRVLGDVGTTAWAEHVAEFRRSIMNKPVEKFGVPPSWGIWLIVSAAILAAGLLTKVLMSETSQSIFLATAVLITANLVAAIIMEVVTRSGGAILGAMLTLVASVLVPLLWVDDAAGWLRENPVSGGIIILIASIWIARGRSRWYLFLVALVLAAAQIGVSFL
jgi:hypothetical protein